MTSDESMKTDIVIWQAWQLGLATGSAYKLAAQLEEIHRSGPGKSEIANRTLLNDALAAASEIYERIKRIAVGPGASDAQAEAK